MAFLPKTKSNTLRSVVVLLALLLGCASINSVRMLLQGDYIIAIVGMCIWMPLAYGLWNLRNVARIGTSILLWFVTIVVPVGAINPFAAINSKGPPFPDVWELVIFIYPFVVAAVIALHVLGKYKNEFA